MRLLLNRSTRLSSQIIQAQLFRRSTPSVYRGFANSVIRQNGQNSDIAATASSAENTPELSVDQANEENRSTGKPSRLAALKKRQKPRNHDDGRSKKEEAGQQYILGQSRDQPIRTRFAPSPTGYLHLGSLRTALFNNLVSKATKGGEFIVRIEDTDQASITHRLVPDAEERIFKDLEWAGLSWSEGPDKGGPFGPYRQSERLDIYKEHTKTLLNNGSAYRCFCKQEDLESQKRAAHDAGKSTAYPGTCRSIPRAESDERAAQGETHVVRLDSGRFGTPSFRDAIYGPFQKKDPEEDFVLMKSDGYPVYHLANVIDDHLMNITHVIRGEEWLISTPKHLALYKAFGWEPPTFAHLGLLVNDDGTKLSKRHDSVNLSTYRDNHVPPMALQSWLANLGASFKRDAPTPRALEDVAENLTYKFTRGGIKLNPGKLDFFRHQYRNLIFNTPAAEQTPTEQAFIRDGLLDPLIDQVHAITASSQSDASDYEPIRPQRTTLDWPQPLDLVPAMKLSRSSQQSYVYQILLHETSRYLSVREIARRLPYFFWRPPASIYRAALATAIPPKELIEFIHNTVDMMNDWEVALDRLVDCVPEDQRLDLHSTIRLIAIGSPNAYGKASRILFNILGQEEWQARTTLVRSLIDELNSGGESLRQQWLEETAVMPSKPVNTPHE
ncbi:Ff.00g106070.m01.CDS01 [Fusarium sp. VM40]|nr:Ff.00g106070.m01.CDS01 [Fusarium sp. VM40]